MHCIVNGVAKSRTWLSDFHLVCSSKVNGMVKMVLSTLEKSWTSKGLNHEVSQHPYSNHTPFNQGTMYILMKGLKVPLIVHAQNKIWTYYVGKKNDKLAERQWEIGVLGQRRWKAIYEEITFYNEKIT